MRGKYSLGTILWSNQNRTVETNALQDGNTLEDFLATSQPAERKLARELEIRPPTPEALLSTIESHGWLTRRKLFIVGLQLCSVSPSAKLGAGDCCVALLAEGEGCMYPFQNGRIPVFLPLMSRQVELRP
jgi:hypothetical protein